MGWGYGYAFCGYGAVGYGDGKEPSFLFVADGQGWVGIVRADVRGGAYRARLGVDNTLSLPLKGVDAEWRIGVWSPKDCVFGACPAVNGTERCCRYGEGCGVLYREETEPSSLS